ncbi:MAG TPA: IS21 family transposase [Candidatus Dormibacteraeota bacterium]|nr:IS21 family transposase [Candidatus Dormibacteraeota bacterium]
MRKVELFEAIRLDHRVKRWGVRRLAHEHHVHRRLVRQALRSALPPERATPQRPSPVLFRVKPFIEEILEKDQQVGRKQRHTAHRIWERITSELQIVIAESTVRRYVGRRKRELGGPVEVMVPQTKTPGVEAEVDFFQASVIMAGLELVLWFFQMRACYSGRVFVRAVARASQQAFLECMVLGLEHFDGVFGAIRMDNHRLAVVKVMRGRTREESDRYIALRSHYLFETRYCLPGERGAHEKGGVEGGQGHFRRNHMVPLPQCRDLIELNQQLLAACRREDERVAHGKSGSKLALWELEKAVLRPLPEERFSSLEYVDSIRVDEKSRARVKSARYSVPARLAGLQVRAEVSSDRVLIFHRGEQVANWERCWEPNGERLDLDHYLEVLQRKPGALWRSVPLHQAKANGKWPSEYTQLFLLLKQRLGETAAAKQMVDVVLLHRINPAQVVHQAVAGALAAGAIDGRAVAVLVRTATEGKRPIVLLDVGELDVYQRPQPQVDAYDQLLEGGRS